MIRVGDDRLEQPHICLFKQLSEALEVLLKITCMFVRIWI